MKYFKTLLPLLVSGVILNACSKDENKIDVPADTILESYYPGSSMEIKELAIYTQDGTITDAATIRGFIERNVNADARSSFYVGVSTVPVPASSQFLQFLNNNRVNVNGINMKITGYKDSVMLISEYTGSPFPAYATTCGALLGRVPQYNAFTECPDGNCASYNKTSPLIVSGANYFIPLLTYAVVTNECAITPTEIPAINILNEDLRSMLAAGDSVLVQYAKLPLVKKATN
jgi:hypothetical protein